MVEKQTGINRQLTKLALIHLRCGNHIRYGINLRPESVDMLLKFEDLLGVPPFPLAGESLSRVKAVVLLEFLLSVKEILDLLDVLLFFLVNLNLGQLLLLQLLLLCPLSFLGLL